MYGRRSTMNVHDCEVSLSSQVKCGVIRTSSQAMYGGLSTNTVTCLVDLFIVGRHPPAANTLGRSLS